MMENIGDLSKIIGVIMENPELINKIRSLSEGKENNNNESSAADVKPEESIAEEKNEEEAVFAPLHSNDTHGKRRYKELLYALKPYVSENRAKTIDTVVSVMEIVGLMKAR